MKINFSSDRFQKILFFVAFCLITVAYHKYAYVGHYGYDDMRYASIANNLTHGTIDFNDHFTFRWPIILLTAASYKLFGISDFSSALPSLFISFSILFLVLLILKHQSKTTVLIGLALTSLNHWSIYYSDKIMTDQYITLSILYCVYILYKYRYVNEERKPILMALLLSLGFIFGIVSKGTNVLIVPLLLYLFILDLSKKRGYKFWFYSLFFTVLIFLSYLVLIKVLTGSYNQLFEAISGNSYLNYCSYDLQSTTVLLKRLYYDYFEMMLVQGMSAGLLIVIVYFFQKGFLKVCQLSDSLSFFLVVAMLLFFSSNFMSISLRAYNPLCIDPRHYLFLIPICAIPAAQIVSGMLETKKLNYSIGLGFFILTVASLFTQGNSYIELYGPLCLLFAVYYVFPPHVLIKKFFVIAFIGILLIKPLLMVGYARTINYTKQKKSVFENLINKKEPCYVITNYVQKSLGDYYNSFHHTNQCNFIEFNKVNLDTLDPSKKKYILLNWYTQFLSELVDKDIPYYANKDNKDNVLIFQDTTLKFSIYEIAHSYSSGIVLQSLNEFEAPIKYWEYKTECLDKEFKYQGENAANVKDYSPTFLLPLDSILRKSFEKIDIATKVFCRVDKINEAKIVVSLENQGKAYKWESIDIKKDIKAFNNWCPVTFDIAFKTEEIKKSSILKIYVLNTNDASLQIDNFEVKIKRIVRN